MGRANFGIMKAASCWTIALVASIAIAAQGGAGAGRPPIASADPHQLQEASPSPDAAFEMTTVVFLDENGNGKLDGFEAGRVPAVVIEAAGRVARAEAGTGRAILAGLPAGTHDVTVQPESLPPFYVANGPVRVTVPRDTELQMPVTLPVGSNRAHTYMAFGDSITEGDGSKDETGYRSFLESRLRGHFGRAQVVNEGTSGTITHRGARRIRAALGRHTPAFTLILYGTNDWSEEGADRGVTVRSLRRIVRAVCEMHSLPVLATLPPTCVGLDDRASPARNRWISEVNDDVRILARAEDALLVDLHAAFSARGELRSLFADGLHPNDAGYEVIAETFFEALTGQRTRHGPL